MNEIITVRNDRGDARDVVVTCAELDCGAGQPRDMAIAANIIFSAAAATSEPLKSVLTAYASLQRQIPKIQADA